MCHRDIGVLSDREVDYTMFAGTRDGCTSRLVVLTAGIVGRRSANDARRPPGRSSGERFVVEGAACGVLVGDVVDTSRLAAAHVADGALGGNRILPSETARRMRDIRPPGGCVGMGGGSDAEAARLCAELKRI